MKRIPPIHIKLPNGSLVTASLVGTIVFNQDFYLNVGLYLPNFSFNLIYICLKTYSKHQMSINFFKMIDALYMTLTHRR
jgi:hypothetical protein